VRAFVVAGTASGVGKTAVTLGLMAALRRRGCRVQGFKVGPDFIDPGHHGAASGTASRTLDGWMLSRAYNVATFRRHLTAGADIGIVEGVMGLFDGFDGRTEAGSTAEMAKWLGLPVVLVVDASAMARSVAALVLGFRAFDRGLRLAGVIFNRVGGPGHLRYLREAVEQTASLRVIGGLPVSRALAIPERHLGLVTREDHRIGRRRLAAMASLVEENLDVDGLIAIAERGGRKLREGVAASRRPACGEGRRRVVFGVARDEAFCFYYADNLELLEAAGADLVFFSPLRDATLPAGVQALYFGGGYPELRAGVLSANRPMRRAIRAFAQRQGGLIYAECGGFMYLTRGIRDARGRFFPLVGLYPMEARMLPARRALGYVEAEIEAAAPHGFRGTVRGHEFHYSELGPARGRPSRAAVRLVYRLRAARDEPSRREGYVCGRALGSYVHLHFGSNPAFAAALVEAAARGGRRD
jgi:cobyrinic acid a,c-diamide synthase